ncbi:hypothetical protein ACG04R_00845 [Roseateles sp. BYS78W]|uniref:Uncharacterized protein n=1 Tax=Pelomonas candidula TaxID=3299025 RepID=A0ABW7H691_9BURK
MRRAHSEIRANRARSGAADASRFDAADTQNTDGITRMVTPPAASKESAPRRRLRPKRISSATDGGTLGWQGLDKIEVLP